MYTPRPATDIPDVRFYTAARQRTHCKSWPGLLFYAAPVIAHFPILSIRAFLLPFIAKQSRMPRIAVDAERPASMPEESVHNDFYAQVLIADA